MSREDDIIRGQRAQQVLDDELVQSGLKRIELDCIEAWISTGPDDTEQRERAYLMFKTAERFRDLFKATVQAGAKAQADTEHEKKQRRFAVLNGFTGASE